MRNFIKGKFKTRDGAETAEILSDLKLNDSILSEARKYITKGVVGDGLDKNDLQYIDLKAKRGNVALAHEGGYLQIVFHYYMLYEKSYVSGVYNEKTEILEIELAGIEKKIPFQHIKKNMETSKYYLRQVDRIILLSLSDDEILHWATKTDQLNGDYKDKSYNSENILLSAGYDILEKFMRHSFIYTIDNTDLTDVQITEVIKNHIVKTVYE